MNNWKKGDVLKSKDYGYCVTFIEYSKEYEDCFIGTDEEGFTYTDWLIDKFEKVEVPHEEN